MANLTHPNYVSLHKPTLPSKSPPHILQNQPHLHYSITTSHACYTTSPIVALLSCLLVCGQFLTLAHSLSIVVMLYARTLAVCVDMSSLGIVAVGTGRAPVSVGEVPLEALLVYIAGKSDVMCNFILYVCV